MSATTAPITAPPPLVSRRPLVVWAVICGVLYSAFTRASAGRCFGGVSGDGGFIDRDGRPTETPPSCVALDLGPSWVVQLAVVVIVVWAIRRAARRESADAARQTLQRATLGVALVCLGAFAVAQTWFALVPIEHWDGTRSLLLPFPFGWVETSTSSMTVAVTER